MPRISLPQSTITGEEHLIDDRIGVDVAELILGIDRQMIYRSIHEIPHWRIGRRVRFSRRALEAFVANGGTSAA